MSAVDYIKKWTERDLFDRFQKKAVKALEEEYNRLDKLADPSTPYSYDERNGVNKALEIIKNLKA